jgi:hypothetical protein
MFLKNKKEQLKSKIDELYNTIKKNGGDIGDKTSKDEKYPNEINNRNPFDGTKHIDTYEDFCNKQIKESFKYPSKLSDYYSIDNDRNDLQTKIDLNDDTWIRGNEDDKIRPFFNNHPDKKDRYSMNPTTIGKWIKTPDGKEGLIINVKNHTIEVDIINDENKHEIKIYDLKKVLKHLNKKS